MKKKLHKKIKNIFLLIICLLFLTNVYATCEKGQIDINTASLEEMMKIRGLGGKGIIAQRVIDARPFNSIEDLIKVSGIKEGILGEIKEQGLACVQEKIVEKEEEKKEIIKEEQEENKEEEKEEEIEKKLIKEVLIKRENNNPEPKVINLETQNIKRENDNEKLNKNNYAIYGLIIFCILLGSLFLIKKFKVRKTEFE